MSVDAIGFEVLEGVLSAQEAAHFISLLDKLELAPQKGGIRRIETLVPEVDGLARSSRLKGIAQQHLNDEPSLVRVIYFNKSPKHNWSATWHQDRTVAVTERFEEDGWGPWTKKAGAWHVQPPVEVLENMITIRVHLDPATKQNGCLKIAASSHKLGLLRSDEVREHTDRHQVIYCETNTGGAVVMRPHVLHASEKSTSNDSRRVLHFEYASFQLPKGISWAA